VVSDAIEWSEVLRRKSVQGFVCQDGDLELDSLRDAQPVQTHYSVVYTGVEVAVDFLSSGRQNDDFSDDL